MIVCTPASIAARNGSSAEVEIAGDDRQLEVGVQLGRAVTREVLRTRGDPRALQAAYECRHVRRDRLGVVPEGAHADHRVRRHVHVGHRGEVPVDADGSEIGADRSRDLLREPRVVDEAEPRRRGIGAALAPLEPRHVTALLVDREQNVVPFGSERTGERSQLGTRRHVVGEEEDARATALQEAADPVGNFGPGEARQQAGRRQRLQLTAHPRTAPAVSPNAIRRWMAMKKRTTGIAVSVEAAISAPQSVLRLVPRK